MLYIKEILSRIDREVELVLLTAQVEMDQWRIRRVNDLLSTSEAKPIRWERVYNYSVSQRVFPLVLKNLQKHFSDYIPGQYIDQWRQEQELRAAKNLSMLSRLFSCLQILTEHEIKAVPFKGPGFTLNVYGDLALRDYCDLDILIFKTDLPHAVELLQKNNYSPVFSLGSNQLKILSKFDNEFGLVHKDGISIDLQWELTGGYFQKGLTLGQLEGQLQQSSWFGRNISQFSNEDMIVYLAVHGCQHLWRQLDNICCLSEQMKKIERSGERIDWDIVLEKTETLGCSRMVKIALNLCAKLFGHEFPPRVSEFLQSDQQALQLSDQFVSSLIEVDSWSFASAKSRRFSRLQLAMLDNTTQKINYGLYLLFCPTRHDIELMRLPRYLCQFYYLLRPVRLLIEYIRNNCSTKKP